MKILSFNDVHATGKSPRSRVDIFPNAIKDKLIEIGNIANKVDVDLILCSGDLFHTPVVALQYSSEIAKIIKSWNKQAYIVPGNHDIIGYNKETISNTMLGMFQSTGVVNLLTRDNPLYFKFNDKTLVIEGQEYCVDIDKDPTNYDKKVKADYNILVAHGMLQSKKILDAIDHVVISDVKDPADITITGHDHKGYGFIKNKDDKLFINIGSIGRTDKLDKHEPSVLLMEIEYTDKFETNFAVAKLNSAKEHDKVFDMSVSIQSNYKDTFKDFVQTIQSSSISSKKDSTDYINHLLNENSITEEVGNLCFDAINVAKTEINTSNITHYTKIQNKIFIKTLKLKNFLSHKNTVIDFDKGFNAIVGGNSTGKTSILRAIQWILYDTPTGTNFFRTGAKECEVTIEFSNGTWIRKRKTKSTAEYIVYDGTQEKNFKGFGNNLPMEIVNCHQMPLINLYKDKKVCLNYGDQLDGLFLVNNSQSEKAEALGKITGADIIDTAIDNSNKAIRNVSKDVSTLTKTKNELEEEIKLLKAEEVEVKRVYDILEKNVKLTEDYSVSLKDIDAFKDIEMLITDTEINLKKVTDKVELCDNAKAGSFEIYKALKELLTFYKQGEKIYETTKCVKAIEEESEKLRKALDDTIKVELLKDFISYYNNSLNSSNLTKNKTKINSCIKSIEKNIKIDYTNSLNACISYLNSTNEVNTLKDKLNKISTNLELPKEEYCNILNSIFAYKNAIDNINYLSSNNKVVEDKLCEKQDTLLKIDEEIKNIKKDLHDNGVCPTCNRKLDDKAIEYIIANGGK